MQHNDTSSNNLFTNIERLGTRDLLSYGQFSYDIILTSIQNNNTLPLSINVFQNDESVPVEAVYCFPIEENAAIYGFVARIDDEREIVAEIKEKNAAQQEYTQALAQGYGAYLLEQDEASNDIFTISVGALKPGSQCHITISYVSELDLLHSSKKPTIRFVVPTTIAPRYSPSHKEFHDLQMKCPDIE
ncbi:unnamed protein product [Rotaria sp. Silwood1]|nr:unnamed protein product [Rotaria sp. Silwood1]